MKLNQMYRNVLDFTLEALTIKVEEDSLKRDAMLIEAMTKIAVAPRAKSIVSTLSEQEKAILKALGLTQKDVKTLQGGLI